MCVMFFSFVRSPRLLFALLALVVATIIVTVFVLLARSGPASTTLSPPSASTGTFGSNVYIFNPTMSQREIQATVDAVANQQVSNQFGTQRYALLFEPGTYGSSTNPLNFQVGYYTTVAGLGLSPNDVVINGFIYVRNQCVSNNCTALNKLLAVVVEPDHQRDHPTLRLLQRRILGSVAGCADASGPHQRANHAYGLLHRLRRSRVAASSPIQSSTAAP